MSDDLTTKIEAKIALELECREGLRQTVQVFLNCGLSPAEIKQLFLDAAEEIKPVQFVHLQ